MFSVEKIKRDSFSATATRAIGFSDLSPDQAEIYNQVLSWHRDPNARQYLKLAGYAGTGKTTMVAALASALQHSGENIAFAAFTGKAVNVMQRKLQAAGIIGWYGTLHSLMYRPKIDNDGKIEGWEKSEHLPFSLIIVDEASMVGSELWNDLLSYSIPILAVGDHGQLPPVGDSVVNLMAIPDLKLEKIHRQAEGNPILALAQWVREGKPHNKFEPADSRVSFISSVSAIANKLTDPLNFGAICYTNKTRASLNRYIRGIRGITSVYPQTNDIVICLKNRKPIFNGMRGALDAIVPVADQYDNLPATVDFLDDGIRLQTLIHFPQFGLPRTLDNIAELRLKYSKLSLQWSQIGMLFDYGYALTCHKAQGSQFKDVVIVWENLFRDADTRSRWMYTAVTRASEQLYIVKP